MSRSPRQSVGIACSSCVALTECSHAHRSPMTWITPSSEALPSVLAVLTVVLGLSWLLGRGTRSAPKQAGRFPNLDGLRAYLALGVVCCHLATLKIDLLDEKLWSWPQNYFLTLAGQGSVAMFFMITGFLFWSKILAAGGKIDALALYKNRFLRIMPLYALFYAVVVTIVAIRSDSLRSGCRSAN